jgi:hypothetical protein
MRAMRVCALKRTHARLSSNAVTGEGGYGAKACTAVDACAVV